MCFPLALLLQLSFVIELGTRTFSSVACIKLYVFHKWQSYQKGSLNEKISTIQVLVKLGLAAV